MARTHYRKTKKRRSHKKLNLVESIKKYGYWRALTYRLRKARLPIWFLLAFMGMILIPIITSYYIVTVFSFEFLSVIFYMLEIIVIIYIIFRILKKLNRIYIDTDLRLFGLRILSLIVGFTGLSLFYFVFIGPVFALFDENIASVLYFGADFGLPFTGKIFFTVFGLGLSIISCYLFFKFKRKTGQFVWVGRV